MTIPFLDKIQQANQTFSGNGTVPQSSFSDKIRQANQAAGLGQEVPIQQAPVTEAPLPTAPGFFQSYQERPFATGFTAGNRDMQQLAGGAIHGLASLFRAPENVGMLAAKALTGGKSSLDPNDLTGVAKVFHDTTEGVASRIDDFAARMLPDTQPSGKVRAFADKAEQFAGSMVSTAPLFGAIGKATDLGVQAIPSVVKDRAADAITSGVRALLNPQAVAGATSKLQVGLEAGLQAIPSQVAAGVATQAALDPTSLTTPEGAAKAVAYSVPGAALHGWMAANPNPVVAGLTGPAPTPTAISNALTSSSPDEARYAYGKLIGNILPPQKPWWDRLSDLGSSLQQKLLSGKSVFRKLGMEESGDISLEGRANLLSGSTGITHESLVNTPMQVNDVTKAWEPSGLPGLKEIYQLIPREEQPAFSGFLLARHRLDPGVEGKIAEGSYSHPDQSGDLARLAVLSPPPAFEQAAKIFDGMNKVNLRNGLSTDLLTLRDFDWLDQNYPSYASGSRAMLGSDRSAPLVSRKGDTKGAFVDPLKAYASSTEQFVNKGRINQFYNNVYQTYLKDPDAMKGSFEIEPSPIRYHQADVDDILTQAKKDGVAMPTTIAQSLAAIKRVGDVGGANGKVTFLVNGEPVTAKVSPEMKAGFDMFQPNGAPNGVAQVARTLESAPRKATSLFLDLSGLGTWRDTFAAYLGAPKEAGLNPLQLITNPVKGLNEIQQKGPYYYELLGQGGKIGGRYVGPGAEQASKLTSLIEDKAKQSGIEFAVKHPMEVLEDISHDLSNSTRMGMYMRLRDGGMTAAQAAMESRRVIADPMQSGNAAFIKAFAASTAYGNTGLQEIANMARLATTDPARVAMKGLISVAIPSAISWAKAEMDDDQQIRDMRNAPGGSMFDFWRIGGKVIGTPRPAWALGQVFGTGMDTFLDKTIKGEDNRKRWAQGFLNQVGVNVIPIGIQQLLTMRTGQQWMGPLGPSVGLTPGAQEGIAPEVQGTSKTSEAAKFLARTTGLDPFRWDAVMKGMFTPDGYRVEQLLERAAGKGGLLPEKNTDLSASDLPMIQRYVKPYPTTNTAPLSQFYDAYSRYAEMNKTVQTLEGLGKFQELQSYMDQHKQDLGIAAAYVQAGTQIASMRKMAELLAVQPPEGFTPDQKKEQIDKLVIGMSDVARNFNAAMKGKEYQAPLRKFPN